MQAIVDTGIMFRGHRILLEITISEQGSTASQIKYEKDHFKDLLREVLKNVVGGGQVDL